MKTVFCKVVALPKLKDDLRINYTTSRGGRTEACYIVDHGAFWRVLADGETIGDKETTVIRPSLDAEPITLVKRSHQESIDIIAAKLAEAVTAVWGSGDMFSAKAKGDTLIITSMHDDVHYYPMLNGTEAAGRAIIEVD